MSQGRVSRADGFAELAWHGAADRLRIALESRLSASIAVDDGNTDAAAGYVRFALRGEWRPLHDTRSWRIFAHIAPHALPKAMANAA